VSQSKSTGNDRIDEADALRAEGEYEAALNLGASVVAEFETQDDPDDVSLGKAYRGLADTHACLGNLERAGLSADRAIAHFDAAGVTDPALALALHTRALVHLESEQMPEAIKALDRAAEVVDGGEHVVELATVLLTMAEVGNATGNSDDAVSLYERVLDDLQSAAPLTEEHAVALNAITAKAFFGLGSTSARIGKPDEAKDYLARSLSFFEAGFGHGHPEMRVALGEIAALYRYLGEDQAAQSIEQELETAEVLMVDIETSIRDEDSMRDDEDLN
jgi:tetratricopeptide (TPR) repeat protein